MQKVSARLLFLFALSIMISVLLGACDSAPAAPTSAPATTAPVVQTQPTTAPTAVPPTAAPTAIPAAPTAVAQAPRKLQVLVGAGKETSDVNVFFPSNVKVRVGDTITWKLNSDEPHTVTFSDGKAPQGATPDSLVPDPRFGAGGKDVLPYFAVNVPGGGPGDFMVNPSLAFPSRAPGGPVESFSGAGFVNSGQLSNQPPAPNAPPPNTFDLTFSKPGIYQYICLLHLNPMIGWVEVVPATTADVPSLPDIIAQGNKEMEPLNALLSMARGEFKDPQKDAGPNNTTLWYVHAGFSEIVSGDQRAQVLEFGPKSLTVKAGDTVVWASTYFHTVTFNPTPPPPEFVIPKPQPNGPPQLLLNPQIGAPARPSPTYDPTKFYNSGALGPFAAANSWSLAFDKPGSYDYFCAVHRDQGMKGTIVVQPK